MIPEAAARGAALLARAWERHQGRFGEITARAPHRFAERDWRGVQDDAVERLEAYGRALDAAVAEMSHYTDSDFLVVNEHFDDALAGLIAIVTSNRLRTARQRTALAGTLAALLE